MSSHTPGPWTVIDGHYPSIREIDGPSFRISCVMWATDLSDEDYRQRGADLSLIAAAPELLAALQGLYADQVDYLTLNNLGGMDNHWMKAARAAIAKATGETK